MLTEKRFYLKKVRKAEKRKAKLARRPEEDPSCIRLKRPGGVEPENPFKNLFAQLPGLLTVFSRKRQ